MKLLKLVQRAVFRLLVGARIEFGVVAVVDRVDHAGGARAHIITGELVGEAHRPGSRWRAVGRGHRGDRGVQRQLVDGVIVGGRGKAAKAVVVAIGAT